MRRKQVIGKAAWAVGAGAVALAAASTIEAVLGAGAARRAAGAEDDVPVAPIAAADLAELSSSEAAAHLLARHERVRGAFDGSAAGDRRAPVGVDDDEPGRWGATA